MTNSDRRLVRMERQLSDLTRAVGRIETTLVHVSQSLVTVQEAMDAKADGAGRRDLRDSPIYQALNR